MKAKHGTRSGVMLPFHDYIYDIFHFWILWVYAIWQAAVTFRPKTGCLTVLKCDVYVCDGRIFWSISKCVQPLYACVSVCLHACEYMLRGKPVVRLHLPAAQQNSVLLRHTESVNNRLNHKGHPLLYFSSSSSTVIMQQWHIKHGYVVKYRIAYHCLGILSLIWSNVNVSWVKDEFILTGKVHFSFKHVHCV